MNYKKLREYQKRNDEKVKLVSVQLIKQNRSWISRLDLYPELKHVLNGQTYTNGLIEYSILTQIPFFDKIILPISRWSTEEEYKQKTGMSIEQTLQLIEDKKIVPILFERAVNYVNVEKDYLDPLFEREVPICTEPTYLSLIRELSGQRKGLAEKTKKIIGKKDLELIKMASFHEALFRIPLPMKQAGLTAEMSADISKWIQKSQKERLSGLYQVYEFLNIIAGPKLVASLLELPAPFWFIATYVYTKLLVYEPSFALDGIVSAEQIEAQVYTLLKDFMELKLGFFRQVFPTDIGKLLIEEFRLIDIRNIGFKNVIEISEETQKARKALHDLDEAVRKEPKEIINRAKTLREVWEEGVREVEQMIGQTKVIKPCISIALGGVGVFIGRKLAGLPGLLHGILGVAIGELTISNLIAENLVKIDKPNYVVALYNLRRAIKK